MSVPLIDILPNAHSLKTITQLDSLKSPPCHINPSYQCSAAFSPHILLSKHQFMCGTECSHGFCAFVLFKHLVPMLKASLDSSDCKD